MDRRTFFGTCAGVLVAVPLTSFAQQPATVWRVGLLTPERPGFKEVLLEGFRELNYIEGRNLSLEIRVSTTDDDMPALAKELVALRPDVMVAITGRAALALKNATRTIPIVIAVSGDAVAMGIVPSLGHPGGNVTGSTIASPDLIAKRLQLLKEAFPQAARIGVLRCGGELDKREWPAAQDAARQLGLQVVPVFFRKSADLSAAPELTTRGTMDAALAFDCSAWPPERLVERMNRSRVPTIYITGRWVRAGGLMSYGPDAAEQIRRAAIFVDKILKGAKPGELPVELPTRFELVINGKTARSLGITISESLLRRADEVL